jgi:lysophospholipid acyltransferase (LPLAT)-like uncharacterized protein
MLAKLKQLATNFVQSLPYYLIRAYSLTFRLKVENELTWLNYYSKNDGTVLLCTYHQQFFSAIRYFKKYRNYSPGLMISKSRDEFDFHRQSLEDTMGREYAILKGGL